LVNNKFLIKQIFTNIIKENLKNDILVKQKTRPFIWVAPKKNESRGQEGNRNSILLKVNRV